MKFIQETPPDEVMVTAQIFAHEARLHSFEIVAGLRAALGAVRR